MKRIISAFILILCLIPLSALHAKGNEKILTIKPNRICHIGEIKAGEVVKKTFYVKNTGSEPLGILELNKSCTCTNASFSVNSLKPGEESVLEVEVDTAGKIGEQEVTVYIKTDKKKDYIVRIIMQVI